MFLSLDRKQVKQSKMKNLNAIGIGLILFIGTLFNQELKAQSFNDQDKNPHDIVYYRPAEQTRPQIKVVYGRPAANDNEVFGTQIPFGQIWKTGSNESTEIKFYCDVMFGNKFVKAGTYSLYTIPNRDYWIVILKTKVLLQFAGGERVLMLEKGRYFSRG